VTAVGFKGVEHQVAFAQGDNVVFAAVEEPDGGAADGAGVVAGEGGGKLPALGRVAPERATGHDGDGGPAVGFVLGEFPGAVAAHGQAGEVGTGGVGVELGGLLVELRHGHFEHVGVGPEIGVGALGHDDDEWPALGMIAHLEGQADLGLPHALGAALAAPVEEENDGPLTVVVAAKVFREIDLEVITGAAELKGAVQEPGLLGWNGRGRRSGVLAGHGDVGSRQSSQGNR